MLLSFSDTKKKKLKLIIYTYKRGGGGEKEKKELIDAKFFFTLSRSAMKILETEIRFFINIIKMKIILLKINIQFFSKFQTKIFTKTTLYGKIK